VVKLVLLLVVSVLFLAFLARSYLWLKAKVAPATNLLVEVRDRVIAEVYATRVGAEAMLEESKEAMEMARGIQWMELIRRLRQALANAIAP